jgi:1-acyl-sn-glycerol-3-phosphate acyltransferase
MISLESMIPFQFSQPHGNLTRPQSSHDTPDHCADAPLASSSPCEAVTSYCSPWLALIAYPLARRFVLPLYFRHIEVTGQENFPTEGPVMIAPTHRSRWDALMVPYAVGQDVTGRVLRFMVSADEMKGIQGWFIRHLGGFPINTRRPGISALRHSVELLQRGQALVIFPEGDIYRDFESLKPGLARLALQAENTQPDLQLQIVPICLQYSHPFVPWRSSVRIRIGQPITVADYCSKTPKLSARKLTAELEQRLKAIAGRVRQRVC